ncbi:methyl-accepting chemotaxis protein [Anaerovorax odorimutans]|uniref:methyl-accepting chemotaxis protein n=1 Tax=Anaerovorax odorimutans TaxID=109327 RepID=UPI0004189A66|nr:methyl-accepting chemotaxis protein [Anaerovorax odorimutans]
MKISNKILLFTTIVIIISIAAVASLLLKENAKYNEQVGYERINSAIDDLSSGITDMLDDSMKNAVSISKNYKVVEAMEKGSFDDLKKALDDLNEIINMDTISITDTSGNIIIRQHQPDKRGDNILSQTNVQKALEGEIYTTLEPGALVKLSCRTGAPIYDTGGNIIGTVVTGHTFEDSDLLDELKSLHNVELTVFSGSEKIASTVMQDESEDSDNTDTEIASKVMEDGQPYTGTAKILGVPYFTTYKPLTDQDGKIVGVIFAGLSKQDAQQFTKTSIIHTLIMAAIIIILCVLILFHFVDRNIKRPMYKLTEVSKMLSEGNLNVDISSKTKTKKDEIALLTQSMGEMISQLQSYIFDITNVLTEMAKKNFTVKSTVEYMGDFKPIHKALIDISSALCISFSNIRATATQFNNTSQQIATSAQMLASGAAEQAGEISEMSASVNDISEEINKNAEKVRLAVENVNNTAADATAGNEQMKHMLSAMNDIKITSDQIGEIIKTIDSIAFQTNILALNAAVEAARAGNAGKGFAVVAEEVRNLSQKSAEAAKQSSDLINSSISAVNKGYEIADNTADMIQNVTVKVDVVKSTLLEIEKAFLSQTEQMNHIDLGLEQIKSVVNANSATSEENAAASEEFSSQAILLAEEIQQFKTERE